MIATGTSGTHVKALADEVEFQLGEAGVRPHHVEGYRSNSWILLDYGEVDRACFHAAVACSFMIWTVSGKTESRSRWKTQNLKAQAAFCDHIEEEYPVKYEHQNDRKKVAGKMGSAGCVPCFQHQRQNRSIMRWWSFPILPDKDCMSDIRVLIRRWILSARKRRMQGYNVLYPDGLGCVRTSDGKFCDQKPCASGRA